jgi:hypothetical protein
MTPKLSEQDQQLISVAGFRDPTEAHFAQGMLEAAGIETLLQGENANALYPGALRVKLQVREAALLADTELEEPADDTNR